MQRIDSSPIERPQQQPNEQPHQRLDNALAMVRCIVAAESFRLNGRLPQWARDES